MQKNKFITYVKILALVILGVFLILVVAFYYFMQPKTNEQILRKFADKNYQPKITYIKFNDKNVRVLSMQTAIDTTLPCILFVHGSPGSSLDFERYLTDKDLHQKANLFAYDRVGYGIKNTGEILHSLEEETLLILQIIQELQLHKVILIGYSYGGGVVMAYPEKVRQKVAIAASVKGTLEPQFWALNLYRWETTRNFIPKIIQAAAKEKIMHIKEFPNWENKWAVSPSPVLAIHGEKDKIVPYKNSLFLASKLKHQKFELVTLAQGNHALIWSDFETIKKEILKLL